MLFRFIDFNTTLRGVAIIAITLICSHCSAEDDDSNRSPLLRSLEYELIGINPFTYEFKAVAQDPDLDPLIFTWDFGEGTVREGALSETFEYPAGDSYKVTVTVSDPAGMTASEFVVVNTVPTEIAIDLSIEHQTIEGFGGFGSQNFPWTSGPFTSERFIDDMVNDLGVTIVRDEVPTNLEITNDNDDPQVLNLEGFNIQEDYPGHHRPLGSRLDFFRDMHAANPDIKFIASVWSPPPWMKANNMVDNGTEQNSAPEYDPTPESDDNQLLPENYDEFAEMAVAYVKILKQETGVDLYAFSIQNEPRFSQSYQSCLYSGHALRDLLKVVGKRFEEEGLTTKLFVPEDVGFLGGIQNLVDPLMNDAEARQYVDMLAVHGYAFDGITAGSQDAQTWETMYNWGAPYDIPLWMTETSGFENNLSGALEMAKGMYTALKFGNISAWVFWTISGGNQVNNYNLMDVNGNKSKRWYVSKNFYRYIRPGAIRTEASSTGEILSLAFKHPEQNGLTIILINPSGNDKVGKVTGQGLPAEYEVFVTTYDKNCENTGTIKSEDAFMVPGQSVITLTGAMPE